MGERHGADIRELIRTHLAPFHKVDNNSVVIEGPELKLNPKAAEQIGLALHERSAHNVLALGSETHLERLKVMVSELLCVCRQSYSSHREGELKGSTPGDVCRRPYPSAMRFDDRAADR
jgi:hypothetical protein